MRKGKVVLGVAPTHRDDASFGVERTMFYKEAVMKKLDSLDIAYVTIDDVCENGLLVSNRDVKVAADEFTKEKVDALFVPFCDFGCEGACAQLAAQLRLPTLLWGPRDLTAQGNDGDIQCGLIAAGKIMRRVKQPFTYIPTCHLEDELLVKGLRTFLAAANVVKAFRDCRVLQVGPRPESFWSVMCNEGELLEKFGVKVFPVALPEVVAKTNDILQQEKQKVEQIVALVKQRCDIRVKEPVLYKSAALKLALEWFRDQSLSTCCAFQCWYALQQELGIWPCTAGALLNEEGFPVTCETDVHGAITCLLTTAATMGRATPLFVDWCFRHPTIANAEYVAHCGLSSMELIEGRPEICTRPHEFCRDWGGHVAGRVKGGEVSFCRFDGDNGDYQLLLGKARSLEEGDTCQRGARMWLEVPDVLRLEEKLVQGPYIHHCAVIHEDILPVMLEALRFIPGLQADFAYEEQLAEAKRYLLTESLPEGTPDMVVTRGERII